MGEVSSKKPYQLFRRKGSLKWYCRFSITGQGQFQRALNTEDEAQADRTAYEAWMRATIRSEQGQAIRERTFKAVAEEFIAKIDNDVKSGDAPQHLLHIDKPTIERYFIEFFGSKPIDAIKEKDIARYVEWRKTYWMDGPGKNIKTITYQRAGRTVSRPAPTDRKPTSDSRLRREMVTLKQVLKQAVKWGYLPANLMPDIQVERPKDSPRAGFTLAEYKKLVELAEKRVLETKVFSYLWRDRLRLLAFITLAGYSGLRPGEVLNLKFGDVVGLEKAREEYWKDHDIRLRVRGKTGARTIVAKVDAVSPLKMLGCRWPARR
jgi:integrase